MTDYSQSGEQAAILEAVEGLPVGRFLDIGAGDGESFSNTRALALAGWGGICVEPAAWAFDKLIDLYADHGGVSCVQAVVTGKPEGLQTWLYLRDDHLSTTVEAEARKWPGVPFKRAYAASISLLELMVDLGTAVSVVSIDAEGRTNELVKAYASLGVWDLVQVICFEREAELHAGHVTLAPPFALVAETPNNVIYRRAS